MLNVNTLNSTLYKKDSERCMRLVHSDTSALRHTLSLSLSLSLCVWELLPVQEFLWAALH